MSSILGKLADLPVAKKAAKQSFGPKPSVKKKAGVKVMKKEEIGQRGKTAEADVTDVLDAWNTGLSTFAFERLPDARSNGPHAKAQICDFMIWFKRITQGDRLCIPLEVKSTEHTGGYLLTKKALEQLPRLNKSRLAGTYPFVLVYFKATFVWRIAPIEFFSYGQPSWDMSECRAFGTPKDALQSTGFFPNI